MDQSLEPINAWLQALRLYLINLARVGNVDYARQDHLKHGAPFSLVAGLDPAAVGNGDLLHDRQAQATADPFTAGP